MTEFEDAESPDIDEEMDGYEEEAKETKAKANATKAKQAKPATPAQIKERYVTVSQPARLAIVDTVKEEIVAEGFADIGTATVAALMLNNQDKLLIQSGA